MIFNSVQKRVVAATLTFGAVVGFAFLTVYVIHVAGELLSYFSSIIWPLAVAGILAMILQPLVLFLEKRLKLGRLKSILLLYLLALVFTFILIAFLLPTVIFEAIQLIQSLPESLQSAFLYVQRKYPWWMSVIRQKLGEQTYQQLHTYFVTELQGVTHFTLPALHELVGRTVVVINVVIGFALIPIYLFFFLRSEKSILENVQRLRETFSFTSEEFQEDVVFLVREFVSIVVSFFRGQILVSLTTGTLYALGFIICGLPFGLVIGLSMGLLNVVPYLGTFLGLAAALPTAFFQDDQGISMVYYVLIVFGTVQTIDGLFITPRIMGKKTGLHPMAVILSILFWGKALGGILGMMLGIPLTAFGITSWRLVKKKYLA